jgi:hypothetical protein
MPLAIHPSSQPPDEHYQRTSQRSTKCEFQQQCTLRRDQVTITPAVAAPMLTTAPEADSVVAMIPKPRMARP